jgi:hypothetical protein
MLSLIIKDVVEVKLNLLRLTKLHVLMCPSNQNDDLFLINDDFVHQFFLYSLDIDFLD